MNATVAQSEGSSSDGRQPNVAKFRETVQIWLDEGMLDLKFFVGDVSQSTMETFCTEANEIEEALASNNCHEHDWENDKNFLD